MVVKEYELRKTGRTVRLAAFLLLSVLGAKTGLAQTPLESGPSKVTLCDIYRYPAAYVGKLVRVHASVTGSDLAIDDFSGSRCDYWTTTIVVLPDEAKPKPDFVLFQDDSSRAFFDALHDGKNVEATFNGRFDAIFIWHDQRKLYLPGSYERKGFGKNHRYGAQIILKSISDVVARDVPRK